MLSKEKLEHYFDRLWPINRSITGPGFRESMEILCEVMPMEKHRFNSGSKILDWTVPLEWRARDAYFVSPDGKKHAEFSKNNLHLVGYSAPFRGKIPFEELRKRLFTVPELPAAIPFVTSYYKEFWGFCLSQLEMDSLKDGEYEIVIDTELQPGYLQVGEAVLPGETDEEVLFSSYLCHPSMANNELSGPLVLVALFNYVKSLKKRRFTYRFVITPETIGSIAYLSLRGEHLKKKLKAGYVLTCIGDPEPFQLKRSRRDNTLADRAAVAVLRTKLGSKSFEFIPVGGSDERQYCSPGFNLPVASLMRSK